MSIMSISLELFKVILVVVSPPWQSPMQREDVVKTYANRNRLKQKNQAL